MLKKYTSYKIFSLTETGDNKESPQKDIPSKKMINKLNYIIQEGKRDSQAKNTILLKDILKSNSITQSNTNENNLIKYKSKMPSKKAIIPQKKTTQKNKNKVKAKIKTTFSNYYADYLFKNSLNTNNKKNFNNFTEITYKPDETEGFNEINAREKTIKARLLKYSGLYNTDSSHKINFKMGININKSKESSPYKRGLLLISQKKLKKIKQEKKKENLNNSIAKMKKITKIKITENSKNLTYINNLSNSNNVSKANQDSKKYKEHHNKDTIKNKKIINLIDKKKQNNKKIDVKTMERNKQNKIINEYEGKTNNEITNKININARKHIFLPLMIKTNDNLEKNLSSSKKKQNSNKKNLHQYKTNNSTSNKEIKKILFQFKENQNKTKTKNFLNHKLFIKRESIEKKTSKNENNSTIKSEDKNTEKDFNFENNKISEKSTTQKSKNLKDYFKMARKVLKNASHSLVKSITNTNNFYEDIELKNKLNERGQITNRYNNEENDDDSNNYTIKRVPVFSGINMFPEKNNKNEENILYKIFLKFKDKNIITCIINFLDEKSIIILSSINKDFFQNLRSIFYKVIFNKIYKYKDMKLIKKLNNSLIKSVSSQYKSDIYEKTSTQTPYFDIIINDIDRTFPKDSKFKKDGKNYNKLFNILTKYSNYNKDIGYAQGLNFLFANALLLYDNEKDAFFYIDGMIKKFKLQKFFAEKNSKLIEEITKFSKILEKYIPEIVNFFEKKYIYHEFFSTGWILTLFSNSMEPRNLFTCWNFMNIYGWKFFYCFVIQILKFYKNVIFLTKENELSHLMKFLLKDKKFSQDLPNILKNTFNFMKKHILL